MNLENFIKPELLTLCELMKTDNENAVWGYGCAYLFGVILTVIFAQFSSIHTKEESSDKSNSSYVKAKIFPELILICVSALIGTILGGIRITFIDISLGNTTGILFTSLFVGVLASKAKILVSNQVLKVFKIVGLALFFAGTGFYTGTQIDRFDIKTTIYGIIISLTAITCGLLMCKIISRRYHLNSGLIIAGGMTSSPAYGAISSKSDASSANLFSFAYFGALFTLVTAIQIILHYGDRYGEVCKSLSTPLHGEGYGVGSCKTEAIARQRCDGRSAHFTVSVGIGDACSISVEAKLGVGVLLELVKVNDSVHALALLDGIKCFDCVFGYDVVELHLHVTLLNLHLCHQSHIHDDHRYKH